MTQEYSKQPVSENDEFLLSRLLDNDLPDSEADALRERIEQEPALRDAFASLNRVDKLLTRQKVNQPSINYAQFRARVMRAIPGSKARRQTTPWITRFPSWLRIGIPLAAAAVIALLVWVQPAPIGKHQPGSAVPIAELAEKTPSGLESTGSTALVDERHKTAIDGSAARQELAVRFNRPTVRSDPLMYGTQVRYVRSEELAEATRQKDETERNREPHYILFTSSPRDMPKANAFAEVFPL